MTGSLLRLATPTSRAGWQAQVRRLRALKRKHPGDEGVANALAYAERVIAELDSEARQSRQAANDG